MQARTIVIAALLAGPGCLPPDDGGPPPSVGVDVAAVQSGSQCDVDDCGNGNSPVIDGVWFWKLNSFRLPDNPAPGEVKIVDVVSSSGVSLLLLAEGDRLVGYNWGTWARDHVKVVEVEGSGLGDTQIHVLVRGNPYSIRIAPTADPGSGPRTVAFWLPRPSAQRVELYRFYFRPIDRRHPPNDPPPEQPLCQRPSGAPPDPGEQWLDAIAFTGDLYNPVTKDITTADTDGWMNIACYMGAPYKMHLMGRTTAAGPKLGIETSLPERQSLLNALTMNACGTGKAFTVQDAAISLKSQRNLDAVGYLPEAVAAEAIWGPGGALCLGHHRLATSLVDDTAWQDAIKAVCPGRVFDSCDAMWNSWGGANHPGWFRTGAPSWPVPR